jgi:probable phosphoglycerate mutase
MGNLVLIRHGETEWSAAGRHTSRTDLDLTAVGAHQALALAALLSGRTFTAVRCSPRRRALRTAELAGLTVTEVSDDLDEWGYGAYEGLTLAEILTRDPGWSLWTHGAPGGETPEQVRVRVDRVLATPRAGDVALVAHGHILRVLAARWVGLSVADGARFGLDTASVSELGFEHDRPVLRHWNQPAD